MARFILVLGIFGLVFAYWLSGMPPERRRRTLRNSALIALALVLVGLAVTGRAHWLVGLLGAALPFVRRLALSLAQAKLFAWLGGKVTGAPPPNGAGPSGRGGERRPPPSVEMDAAEARRTLGVGEDAGPDEIREAHRRLMQRMHPDRGGSPELASRINRAKDVLLGSRSKV